MFLAHIADIRRATRLVIVALFALQNEVVSAQADSSETTDLPNQFEVTEYIAENWTDWSQRFARTAGRIDSVAKLQRVDEVTCYLYYGTPECRSLITALFEDGTELTQEMVSSFVRTDNGELKEVLVLVHPRSQASPDTSIVPITEIELPDSSGE